MRLLKTFSIIFALLSTCSADASQREAIEQFKDYLSEFRLDNKIPSLSVAIAKDGEIILLESIGFQDHDGEEPTTKNTSYLAASITKTFTGATLLAMEADGHINLDDDFTTLSDWDRRCQWLRNSGIIFGGGTLDNGQVIDPVNCDMPISLRHVLQNQVQGQPGTGFFYNPIVFGRLSNWVEENTGRSWRYWVNKYVIEPGQLEHVAAGWRDPSASSVLTHLAPPFKHDATERDGIAPSILPNTELNASSGIIASAKALAEYSIALDSGKILSDTLRQKLWTPPVHDGVSAPYAHGWFVQQWQNQRVVWHGGWWPDAYAGLLLKVPEQKLPLVALGNTDGIRHEVNSLTSAQIEKNPLAKRFLELFISADNDKR